MDMELKEFGVGSPYNVTVNGTATTGDEKSDGSGGGRGSSGSSDAILRIEDIEAQTPPAPVRGIVRTTKVTIVTS